MKHAVTALIALALLSSVLPKAGQIPGNYPVCATDGGTALYRDPQNPNTSKFQAQSPRLIWLVGFYVFGGESWLPFVIDHGQEIDLSNHSIEDIAVWVKAKDLRCKTWETYQLRKDGAK